jgi:transposase-like protein
MDHRKLTFLAVLQWTDDECRQYLEQQRWPDGPHCPKCGEADPWKITRQSKTKNAVRSLYRCRACKRQYTATVGTIFEDSKIPLPKWFAAIFLMCGSKKGISAHQLHRELDITYKSAWFMCHRIREAMGDKDFAPLDGVIEADETYITRKTKRGHKVWREHVQDEEEMGIRARSNRPYTRRNNPVVFGMLERDGRVRTMHVKNATSAELGPIMVKNIKTVSSRLITDGHPAYRLIRKHLPHEVVDHELEYVRGDVHTQGIENYWSVLKRGLIGVFQHVDERYLGRYLNEFEFRFNRRKVSDAARFALLMRQVRGRVLWYCRTPQPENPYA